MMHMLTVHPDCSAGPVQAIEAAVHPTATGCTAQFRLSGNTDALRLPDSAAAMRTNNLWQTTCFEVFWQPEGSSLYHEFNLSPSTQWAAYEFDNIREHQRDSKDSSIRIECTQSDRTFDLIADIESKLAVPARAALTAVVELDRGSLQYWALAFEPGRPDFHVESGRTIHIAGRL